MQLRNREDAAALLAERLASYRGQHPLVLGVPRGAVPMARVIAEALEGDLDVVLVRKLRAPLQPELAVGALDEQGTILRGEYADEVPQDYLLEEVRTQAAVLRERRAQYTRARQPRMIIVATPVAAPSALARIRREADEVVCLLSPEHFMAVGQFYDDFSEVTDDMVVAALADGGPKRRER